MRSEGLWESLGWQVHFVYNANYSSLIGMKIEKYLLNDKITVLCQKKPFKHCVTSYRLNKNELWKTVRLTNFQIPQLLSLSIFLRFVHPCLLSYLLCYPHILSTFCAVILMSHFIWWQFPQFEFWYIIRETTPSTPTYLFSRFLVNLNTLLTIKNRPRYHLPCPAIEHAMVLTTCSIMQKSWLSGCSRLTNCLNKLIKARSPPTSRTLDWHSAEYTEIWCQMFWGEDFFNIKPMEKCLLSEICY